MSAPAISLIDELGTDAFVAKSRYHDSLGLLTKEAKEIRRGIAESFRSCCPWDIDADFEECIELSVHIAVEDRMRYDMPAEQIKFSEHIAFFAIASMIKAPELLESGNSTFDSAAIRGVAEYPSCLYATARLRFGNFDHKSIVRYVEQVVAAIALVEFAFRYMD